MGYWKTSATFMACALASTMLGQSVRVVNMEQYGGPAFYTSNTNVESLSAIGTEPALQLRFNAIWAQAGVKFTAPNNWGTYTGFAVRLQNLENRDVSLGIMFDRNATYTNNSKVSLNLRPLETRVFYVDFSGFNPLNHGLRSPIPALAEGYTHKTPDDRPGPLSGVYRCHFYNRYSEPARIRISSIYGVQVNNSVVGLVDAFGQLARRTWDWKVAGVGYHAAQMLSEQSDLTINPGRGEHLGATSIPRTSHRGSWRLFKTAAGKSYFLSPEGRYFWSLGVCQVGARPETIVEGRESMFAGLPAVGAPKAQFYGMTTTGPLKKTYSHYSANLLDKFGESWATERHVLAGRRLKSWGFNTLGSGSDLSQLPWNSMPFTITLTTNDYPVRIQMNHLENKTMPDAYGSDFLTWAKSHFTSQGRAWFNNAMMIGAYVDGEKPWGMRNGTSRDIYQLPLAVVKSPRTQPSKTAMINQLVAKYTTIANLNAAWGTTFASWTALRNNTADLTDPQVSSAQTDLSAFLTNFAKIYAYRIRTALTSCKTGLIYLGGREHLAYTPAEVMNAIAVYTDVLSITLYEDPNDVPWTYLASLPRPVMVAEFSYSSQEGNAMPQAVFPQVESYRQIERSAKTRQFLQRALETKNVIGAHWFQYVDQPVTGLCKNSENFAWGMVDVTDQPYEDMVSMFRSFTSNMYLQRGL